MGQGSEAGRAAIMRSANGSRGFLGCIDPRADGNLSGTMR